MRATIPVKPALISTPKKIVLWMWKSPVGVYARKILNTFRPTANILRKLQVQQREKDALIWANETHYKTAFYSVIHPEEMILVDYICSHVQKNASILDICCNQGRFLLELRRRGFSKLYGFDIMDQAIQTLRQSEDYNPDLIHVEHCLAQDYFLDKADNAFDWAITYTATIELIHPEFDIFKALGRTVRKGMILVINENGHAYPRFYRLLHRLHGFRILSTRKEGEITMIHSVKITQN